MGVSGNRGTLFWGPYDKDPTTLRIILELALERGPQDLLIQISRAQCQVQATQAKTKATSPNG